MRTAGLLARISVRERRVITAGIGIAFGAWLLLRVAPGVLRTTSSLQERAAAAQSSLMRSRELLAAEPAMRDSLRERARRLVAQAPRLFGGASPTDAAAEFSSHVSGSAERRRVRIARLDARPDTARSVFLRLSLRVEAEGDLAGITGWLADLESGPKLVNTASLNLQAPEPGSPASQAERLRLTVTFTAWATVQSEGFTDAR